jgi:hypothetical protein
VSQWTARKFDKKATKEVADANGTTSAAGRYNKALLPMNTHLEAVHSKTNAIRSIYYRNTLPWGIEGTQLLPSANYMEFMSEFRKQKGEWELLVSRFLIQYGTLRDSARGFLAGLYNDDDYPTQNEVQAKFSIDMAVLPVPNTDFRVQLSDAEMGRIQSEVETRVAAAGTAAMKDVWRRLYERVEHMQTRLADHKAVFRDSMLDGTKELCDLLTRLNVLDDPDLEAMRREVEEKLTRFHPDTLRNDPDVRRNTASEAQAIMDKMAVYMGAA